MALLTRCCCCCSLKRGTIILGVLAVIGGLMGMTSAILNYKTYITHRNESRDLDREGWRAHVKHYTTLRFAIEFFFILVAFTISCLMIHGARKEQHRLILPYLIFTMQGIVISFLLGILSILAEEYVPAIGIGLYIGLSFYFWYVVYSYYKNLKESACRPKATTEECHRLNPLSA